MGPGVLLTYSGRWLDLTDPANCDFVIEDVAWALGRILRYNGHLKIDYNVAMHCIVMSYMVPEMFALEALLHDAGEAFMGDIIKPIKSMFPEVEALENRVTGSIMKKVAPDKLPGVCLENIRGEPVYVKSTIVSKADKEVGLHEWYVLRGDKELGVFSERCQLAEIKAHDELSDEFLQDMTCFAYLKRFHELIGDPEGYTYEKYARILFPEESAKVDAAIAERLEGEEDDG
jgi:5'-deoxynucleotidase YfbR-like HD superfamily hydrolase